jgi:hypothetical protein
MKGTNMAMLEISLDARDVSELRLPSEGQHELQDARVYSMN